MDTSPKRNANKSGKRARRRELAHTAAIIARFIATLFFYGWRFDRNRRHWHIHENKRG